MLASRPVLDRSVVVMDHLGNGCGAGEPRKTLRGRRRQGSQAKASAPPSLAEARATTTKDAEPATRAHPPIAKAAMAALPPGRHGDGPCRRQWNAAGPRRLDHVSVTCRVTAVGTTCRPPSRTSRRSPLVRPRGRAIVIVPGLFGVPGPGARRARLVPGLAAAAATLARAPHGQLDGDVAAAQRAAPLQVERDLDRRARLGADERVAHALHRDGERREIDARLVRETGATRIGRVGREAIDAWQGGRRHEPLSPARGLPNDRDRPRGLSRQRRRLETRARTSR